MLLRYFFLLLFLLPIKALALIEVDITRGNLNPLPVAVSPLSIDENSRESFKKIYRTTSIEDRFKTFVLTQPSQLRSNTLARFRLEPSNSLKVSMKARNLAQT